MRIHVAGHEFRRSGKTTALLDLGIMNARCGATVHFWSDNRADSDNAARLLEHRIAVADLAHDARFSSPKGIRTVEFSRVGGRLEFHVTDSRFNQRGPDGYPGVYLGRPDVHVVDNNTGYGPSYIDVKGVY